MNKTTIVVWFSCGAASAVAAKKTLELYGSTFNVRVVNTPIAQEHQDNLRFLVDVERWLGVTIEFATNKDYPDNSINTVFKKRKYMSGVAGAPCTTVLKKEARYQFEKGNEIAYHVLGFTSEERNRFERFKLTEIDNVIHVLKEISKQDCFDILINAGIKLPDAYLLGMPNANCIGCVKATSPTYWNHVRNIFPEVFKERAELSRELGCKLTRYKGQRLFLDELPADANGRPMKSLKTVECGIFCEEK